MVNEATVTAVDVPASNGVIHVIDTGATTTELMQMLIGERRMSPSRRRSLWAVLRPASSLSRPANAGCEGSDRLQRCRRWIRT